MRMKFVFAIAIFLASSISHSALAANLTINFDGITGNIGAPFTSYTQSGFTVSPSSGSWLESPNFGNPGSSIYFTAPGGNAITSSIVITGAEFMFASIDLYSSTTSIPYVFTGFLNGASVFSASGTVPNTFGSFAQVKSPYSTMLIDTLQVSVTNPAAPCCSNPVGVDNIALVTRTASAPEPAAFSLLLTGLLLSSGILIAARLRYRTR